MTVARPVDDESDVRVALRAATLRLRRVEADLADVKRAASGVASRSEYMAFRARMVDFQAKVDALREEVVALLARAKREAGP